MQFPCDVLPVVDVDVPAGHGMQWVRISFSWYVPMEHGMQGSTPLLAE